MIFLLFRYVFAISTKVNTSYTPQCGIQSYTTIVCELFISIYEHDQEMQVSATSKLDLL